MKRKRENMKKAFLLLIVLVSVSLSFFSCRMSIERQYEIFLQAHAKADEGDFRAAIDILENNIRRIDRGFAFYFYRGLFTELKDFPRNMPLAMEDYRRAYRLSSNFWDINNQIGAGYLLMEKYEKAVPFLERAYELFPLEYDEMPLLYWRLARVYFRTGRLEDALRMNARAIELRGDHWDYFQQGEILSAITGDVNELIEHYKIARKIAPDNLWLQRDFSLRLIRMGYIEKAYELYTEWLVEQEDFFVWSLADMGYIHMLKGNWDRSIELLRQSIQSRNEVLTVQYLSFYHFFTGNYEEAFLYEFRARFMVEPSGVRTFSVNSIEEFMENYRNNWQFQKLLQRWAE